VTESQAIVTHLRTLRLPVGNEQALQDAVFVELQKLGVEFVREHRFNAADRVDFFTAAGLAIELKVDGTRNAVLRQLIRYAEHDCVKSLLLITTRSKHLGMPATLQAKPLAVYHVLSL